MLEIRDATVADAPAMGTLMVETWLNAHRDQIPGHLWEARRLEWTPEVSEHGWRRTIAAIANGSAADDAVLVACDVDRGAHRIVGIANCVVSRHESILDVSALYVLKENQRRGVGRTLLKAVTSRFVGRGLETMEIAVLKANQPARRFYEHLGGELERERYSNEGGDVLPEVVYRWSLPAAAERFAVT